MVQSMPVGRRGTAANQATVGDMAPDLPARTVLDAAQANIFFADAGLNLVYMNPTAVRTIRTLAPDIEQVFKVPFAAILGGSIHRFHRDPAAIERILHDPSALPRNAQFSFGNVTLDTRIERVVGPAGTVLGYVVAWEDISEKIATEQRAQVVTARLADTVHKNHEVCTAIESVAAAMEQMSATVEEIARNGGEAAAVVSAAVDVVEAATKTMDKLSEASTQINEVVNAISQIARQTNLLALNATIEAARAGESGKGFAVVAGEVKDLSHATQAATERIGELIKNVQVLSGTASHDIAKIAEIVDAVRGSQHAVSSAVEEQTVTNKDIARNLSMAAQRAEVVTADLVDFLAAAAAAAAAAG